MKPLFDPPKTPIQPFPRIDGLHGTTLTAALKAHGLKLKAIDLQITMVNSKGPPTEQQTRPAWIINDSRAVGLAVHPDHQYSDKPPKKFGWNITHVPTGIAVLNRFPNRQTAILAMIQLLADMPPGFWTQETADQLLANPSMKSVVHATWSRWR